MILIFSDKDDYSTNKVMEYLFHWDKKVIRVNREDSVDISYKISIANKDQSKITLTIANHSLALEDIKSIWFRRGGFYFKEIKKSLIKKCDDKLHPQLNDYFSTEQKTLNSFVYQSILSSGIRVLGNPFVMNTEKLSVLKKAAECGLEIPKTMIATEKEDIKEFISQNEAIITKAIQDNFTPVTSTNGYGSLTEEITLENLESMSPRFFPSLFQEKLKKLFELRIFYLDGDFFSVAIFSQQNEQTSVDFRNYDFVIPNRKTVFKLPHEIKMKLKKLLKFVQLNTASIDMVYTTEEKFVFLEINPVGQYDMVGRLMNFQLDKKIAQWLTKN